MKKTIIFLSFIILISCNKKQESESVQQNNSQTTTVTAVITNNSSKNISEVYSTENGSEIDWKSVKSKSKNLLGKNLNTNESITFTFECNNEKGFTLGIFDGEKPTESGGMCCANYKATLSNDGFSGGCE